MLIATNAGLHIKLIQTDFKLSPQKPCALPSADIAFRNALLVSPGGDYADMGFGQGKVYFHFRPPVQGQRYLIDWCVQTRDTEMFQMSIKSAVVQQVTLPGKSSAQHITFILEPQSQGDFEFQLVCPNQIASNTWEFYFVEASVLK